MTGAGLDQVQCPRCGANNLVISEAFQWNSTWLVLLSGGLLLILTGIGLSIFGGLLLAFVGVLMIIAIFFVIRGESKAVRVCQACGSSFSLLGGSPIE